MKVKYYAKDYKIGQNFKEILEKKLTKLDKYFPRDYDVKVSCSTQNKQEKLEITINADGLYIRSEVVSDNMFNNIDLALPKIEKQIVKNSGKYKQKFKNVEKNVFEFLSEMPVMSNGKVVKTKHFELEPITVSDAEAQMDALGHSFFIFLNAETGLVSVLYKRADNDLGLIDITY